MTVGIIGLGLIGGSLAKAYKKSGHTVAAQDCDRAIAEYAKMCGAADLALTDDRLAECDLILIATYPAAAIEFLEQNGGKISPGTLVIDCCGTKTAVCEAGFAAAARHGFEFAGGHPMAGKEQSGFKHSDAELFKGAVMVIVPPPERTGDIDFLTRIKTSLSPLKLARITVTTAQQHDKIIAFTSQLPHLASNAFIKSPTAAAHNGFSAGSYRDLTRVAWLNEDMWTELFLENREHLIGELDFLLSSLGQYRAALESNDSERLRTLLREGKLLKERLDRS